MQVQHDEVHEVMLEGQHDRFKIFGKCYWDDFASDFDIAMGPDCKNMFIYSLYSYNNNFKIDVQMLLENDKNIKPCVFFEKKNVGYFCVRVGVCTRVRARVRSRVRACVCVRVCVFVI